MAHRIIYSIGHSTLPIEQFISLLHQHRVTLLADVRTIPGSNAFPQYNAEALSHALNLARIQYAYFPALGGRRGRQPTVPPETNAFWENKSFRYYADYATLPAFEHGLHQLETAARARITAYMCAETLWWRCHRRIITDHLLARGWDVKHLMATGRTEDAHYTEGAVVKDGKVTYPLTPHETPDAVAMSTSPEE